MKYIFFYYYNYCNNELINEIKLINKNDNLDDIINEIKRNILLNFNYDINNEYSINRDIEDLFYEFFNYDYEIININDNTIYFN